MYCVWLVSSFFKQEIRVKFWIREKQGFTSENSFTFHGKTVFFFTNLSPLAYFGCLKTWRSYFTLRHNLKAANKLGRIMHLHNIYLQCHSWLPSGKNRRTTPQNQKHPDKWKPLKIFILQSISALALPLADFPKCHCFLCKSTASSTWTKNMWASWFLFLLPSQANWAVLLHKASVGVGQAKLDREGCTGAISEARWQRLPCC